MECTLCNSPAVPFESFSLAFDGRKEHRDYWGCPECDLVFMDPSQHLGASVERERYLLHDNDSQEAGYRRFASRLWTPMSQSLSSEMRGLDYGCGPDSAIVALAREQGFAMNTYDPFFQPDTSVLQEDYDFVVCTEAVEHFSTPKKDWDQLKSLLKPHGHLGIMTQLRSPEKTLMEWPYTKDPTHVSFYSEKTMHWLARKYQWTFQILDGQSMLFQPVPGS